MPYKLVKKDNKLQLVLKGKVIAKNTTEERARKQIAAIEINKLKHHNKLYNN